MKKVLVISDTHGRNDDIEGVLAQVGDVDLVIHCGDLERGDTYVRSLVDCPMVIVSGNNDYYLDLPMEEIVEFEGFRILVTHGHYQYVNSGVMYLKEYVLELEEEIDVVMYGHTHVPYFEYDEEDKLAILNPGSLSYPRQFGHRPTFLIMTIDDEGNASYDHYYYTAHFDELNI